MVAIFLVVFVAFLFVANLVVFEALASIFFLTTSTSLWVLGVSLGMLSVSFLLTTLFGMQFYNTGTRVAYTLSSIWIGFFTYLFLAMVLYGALVVSPFPWAREGGIVMVFLALLLSVYGVLHARKIVTRQIEVVLPNLPEAWRGRSAIWISDVHLGQIYGAASARRIVDEVNRLPHDVIFIGGDLYDGTGAPDLAELTAPLQYFSGHLGIYFVTGNHEEFGAGGGAFLAAVRAAHIRPLIDEMVEIDGLQIIGVDYQQSAQKEHFRATLARLAIDPHKPSLLLKHEPKDIDVAEAAGISFQLSGHTHRGQMWPFGSIADLIYKGFAYGLKRSGAMQVYTSSGVGTWGPPMRVGTDCEIVRITFRSSL